MRAWLLGVVLLASSASAEDSAAAMAVYEEGKALYDAKRYDEALAKFDEAARLEPGKARWQYNRGLALRKLKRNDEARQAFYESQRLDPEYKRDEIREKLGDVGPPSTGSSDSGGDAVGGVIALGICGLIALVGVVLTVVVFRAFRAKPAASTPPPSSKPSMHQARAHGVMRELGPRLARLEHAMSVGEDAEARKHLDLGFTLFTQVRELWRRDRAEVREVETLAGRLREAVELAEARLRARHGAAFDTALGPRVGCFFCARPIPNEEARQVVSLKVRGQPSQVQACQLCARRAGTNVPPKVVMVGDQHWAANTGIDPYAFAYSDQSNASREVPLGVLSREGLDVGHLAMLAGLAGVAGAVAGKVLDVDALAESEAATAAAAAAARSAVSRRSDSSSGWRDHS